MHLSFKNAVNICDYKDVHCISYTCHMKWKCTATFLIQVCRSIHF